MQNQQTLKPEIFSAYSPKKGISQKASSQRIKIMLSGCAHSFLFWFQRKRGYFSRWCISNETFRINICFQWLFFQWILWERCEKETVPVLAGTVKYQLNKGNGILILSGEGAIPDDVEYPSDAEKNKI